MKRRILFLTVLLSLIVIQVQAQVLKNVTTAGTLESLFTEVEKTSVTNLKVTGTVNYDDLHFIHSSTVVSTLDLKEVSIASTGSYAANEIPINTFNSNTRLVSITLPDNLQKIGVRAFYGNTALTSLVIPNSVSEIGERAFANTKSLVNITLPTGLKHIPNSFLQMEPAGSGVLEDITIPESVESIGNSAFYGTNLYEVHIPAAVTNIGQQAFYFCTNLDKVTFGSDSQLETIGGSAFYNAPLVFENDDFLTNLANLKTINGGAFYGSTFAFPNLKPSTGITYVVYSNLGPFSGVKMKHLDLSSFTTLSASFAREITAERVTLSPDLLTVGAHGFNGATLDFDELILPSQLTTLGNLTFQRLQGSITTVDLSKTQVTAIANGLFSDAEITTIKLPATLTTIPKNTSSSIKTFPGTLTNLYIANDNPIALNGSYSNFFVAPASQITLHVPPGTKADYEAAAIWSSFTIVDDNVDKKYQTITDFEDRLAKEGDVIEFPVKTEQGLDITYSIEDNKTSVATLAGNKLTIVGAGEVKITATQAGNDQYAAFSKTITIATSFDYTWLQEVAIAVEGNTAKVVGPAESVAKFTKFFVDGTEVTLIDGEADLSEKSGELELKATTANGDVVKLKYQK